MSEVGAAKKPQRSFFGRVVGALLSVLSENKKARVAPGPGPMAKALAWKPGKHPAFKVTQHLRRRMRGNWRARRAARLAMQKESRCINRRQTSRNWA